MIDPLVSPRGCFLSPKSRKASNITGCGSVPQMHDATALYPEASKESLELWKEYMATEWPAYMKRIESAIPNPVMRVIPVNAKVDAQSPDTCL